MENEIGKISSKDIDGYKKLLAFTSKIFDKGFTELASVPFNNFIFMSKQIPSLLKLKSYKSVYSLVSSFIKEKLIDEFIFYIAPKLMGKNKYKFLDLTPEIKELELKVIETQYMENYDVDEVTEEGHWKFKGGNTFIVDNVDDNAPVILGPTGGAGLA